MAKKALLFGSIGAVVESSDIQRRAYNQALREAGFSWEWDRETYATLLAQAGGKERLEMLASATGDTLTPEQIERIHTRKTEIAAAELTGSGAALRPGVAQLLKFGKQRGMRLGFVTTTYEPNIKAIFTAVGKDFAKEDFSYIGTRNDVENGKPSPDAYEMALAKLGLDASEALAIEDTAMSVMSAKRAHIDVIATPGALTKDQDFWQADLVVDSLADADGEIDRRVLAYLQ